MREERHGLYEDIEIDVCPECEAMWLDAGELDRLDESIRTSTEQDLAYEEVPEDDLENWAPLLCPRCERAAYRDAHGVRLVTIAPVGTPDLVLERCPRCAGIFLEAGQLDTIRELVFDLDSEETRDA